MRLSLLLKLLLPVSMMTLVSCTLVISAITNPAFLSGLGSGVVNIEDDIGTPLGTCTVTEGVAQADCTLIVEPETIVVLKPVADPGSAFGGWIGLGSDLNCAIAGDECTVEFGSEAIQIINVSARFELASCQGTDACGGAGTVGEDSCNHEVACWQATGPIGNNACNNQGACAYTTKPIGLGSCNGFAACDQSDSFIGFNSCNGPQACRETTVFIGNNSCNTSTSDCRDSIWPIGDCRFNDVKPAACEED